MTDIKLPPLPPLHIVPRVEPVDYPEVAQVLMDYARAAVLADRERREGWQPIETAPRDGTTVVVYFKGHGPMTVAWEDPWGDGPEAATWCVTDHKHGPYPVRGYRTGDDTHWMPLPEPPTGDKQQ